MSDWFSELNEHELSSGDIFPIGYGIGADGQKTIDYVTIPRDEFGRFYGRFLNAFVQNAKDGDADSLDVVEDIADAFISEFFFQAAPPIMIASKFAQLLSGDDTIKDDFYGTNIVDPYVTDEHQYWQFASWTANRFGIFSRVANPMIEMAYPEWSTQKARSPSEKLAYSLTGVGRFFRSRPLSARTSELYDDMLAEDREWNTYKDINFRNDTKVLIRNIHLWSRTKDKLDDRETAKLGVASRWYYSRYIPRVKKIKAYMQNENYKEAKNLIEILK